MQLLEACVTESRKHFRFALRFPIESLRLEKTLKIFESNTYKGIQGLQLYPVFLWSQEVSEGLGCFTHDFAFLRRSIQFLNLSYFKTNQTSWLSEWLFKLLHWEFPNWEFLKGTFFYMWLKYRSITKIF